MVCFKLSASNLGYSGRMAVPHDTEAWQRGAVPGFEPLLMPVVHALIQVQEDLQRLVSTVPAGHVWLRPGGAASIAFHVSHTGGALDRLFTYARGETLSDAQRAAARAEGQPADTSASLAALALALALTPSLATALDVDTLNLFELDADAEDNPALQRGLSVHLPPADAAEPGTERPPKLSRR